ncbi:hypothetical protein [Sphingobium sp. Ant17]|uniref:hypothetical protein n=1 Tax=Sphingobium sp. Ant17 TaxID=1461752 RepID=UPI0004BA2572|nr:hypothetical protein [Sphingobium sp. Ant17]
MRQSLALVAGLMLVLSLWTGLSVSAAHAAEIVGCIELSAGAETMSLAMATRFRATWTIRRRITTQLPQSSSGHATLDGLATTTPIARTALRIDPAIEPDAIAAARNLRPPIA